MLLEITAQECMCGKSCRLRWINYLRADLKRGNFTLQDQETIVQLHQSLGYRFVVFNRQSLEGKNRQQDKELPELSFK
ncbi:hypothetical protein GQ457_04G029190 [Hibiscus cannabinus]